jgi:hypothetical protein
MADKTKDAVDWLGSVRIIFGTDGPHEAPDAMGFAPAELAKIRGLTLNPDDEAAIWALSRSCWRESLTESAAFTRRMV